MISSLLHSIHKRGFKGFRIHPFIFWFLYLEIVSAGPSYGITADRVLATVNNEAITLSDYQRFIVDIGNNTENKNMVDETVLKRLIEEKVILHEAIKKGIEVNDMEVAEKIEEFKRQNALSDEDFEKTLKEEGMDIHSYKKVIKDKIMSLKLMSVDVDSKVVITDKEIENFYNANKKDFLQSPEKVEVKAIFLKLNKDASLTEITDLKRKTLKIVARLKDGEDFNSLVEEYSDEPLRSEEGRLGEFSRGTLIPALDDRAFSLKIGEISEPIWVSEGIYVLQLVNKISESLKPIEEVKENIHKHLYEQKREKLFNEWMRTLWERASITIIK
jgi:parvulin-like peptidyl-prolyl isomerase